MFSIASVAVCKTIQMFSIASVAVCKTMLFSIAPAAVCKTIQMFSIASVAVCKTIQMFSIAPVAVCKTITMIIMSWPVNNINPVLLNDTPAHNHAPPYKVRLQKVEHFWYLWVIDWLIDWLNFITVTNTYIYMIIVGNSMPIDNYEQYKRVINQITGRLYIYIYIYI